jgi:hypothetical protein
MLQGKMLAPDSVGKFQECVNIYMYMYHDNSSTGYLHVSCLYLDVK